MTVDSLFAASKPCTGVVLAGGRSSRFGQDKGLYPYLGKPLVEHALDILRPNIQNLLISTNNHPAYAYLNRPMIADVHPDCGPIGGIYSALCDVRARGRGGEGEKERGGEEIIAVISCDTPHIPSKLYAFMLDHLMDYDAVIPVHKGFKETTCAIYTTNCLPGFEQAIKEKQFKILDALKNFNTLFLDVSTTEFYREGVFHNINYLKDV